MTLNTQDVAGPTGTDQLYVMAVQVPHEQASSYLRALYAAYTPQRVAIENGLSMIAVDQACFVVFCRNRAYDAAIMGQPLTRRTAAQLLARALEHAKGRSAQVCTVHDALKAEQDMAVDVNETEGWTLTAEGRIQHLESAGLFNTLQEANGFLVTQAGKGSVRHAEALAFDQRARTEG
jgi:hypothetical protein